MDLQRRSLSSWLNWVPLSDTELEDAETRIFESLKTPSRRFHVDVGCTVGDSGSCNIWTIALNETSPNTPLVLLHGLYSAVGFWVLNLDSFAQDRPVYAIDLPGMGRSSRSTFSGDASTAENEYLLSIERWRQAVGLEKFILCGHSFGGFLSAAYTLKYPERVYHLILEDPWGIGGLTVLARAVGPVLQFANPLKALRGAYWFGPTLFKKHPLIRRLRENVENAEEVFPPYIYQLNAQTDTGYGFHSLMQGLLHAKFPIIDRIDEMPKEMPLTFIYGERSWMERSSGYQIKEERFNSYVNVQIIERCGHDVHVERSKEFNIIVNETCSLVDKEQRTDQDPS